jgi:hypothetical protein
MIDQAVINLAIMLTPCWLMLVYIIVEELVDSLG